MPLEIGKGCRGMTSVHAKRHKKLMFHHTVTREAFHFVSWLVDQNEILEIDLGKVGTYRGKTEFRVDIDDNTLSFLVKGNFSYQIIRTTIRPIVAYQPNALLKFLQRCEEEWQKSMGNPVETR